MQTTTALTTPATFGVFEADRAGADVGGLPGLDEIERFYRDFGYVLLRGAISDELTDRMETECAAAQADVLAARVSERYGSTRYLDDAEKIEKFVNYVEHVQELSPAV